MPLPFEVSEIRLCFASLPPQGESSCSFPPCTALPRRTASLTLSCSLCECPEPRAVCVRTRLSFPPRATHIISVRLFPSHHRSARPTACRFCCANHRFCYALHRNPFFAQLLLQCCVLRCGLLGASFSWISLASVSETSRLVCLAGSVSLRPWILCFFLRAALLLAWCCVASSFVAPHRTTYAQHHCSLSSWLLRRLRIRPCIATPLALLSHTHMVKKASGGGLGGSKKRIEFHHRLRSWKSAYRSSMNQARTTAQCVARCTVCNVQNSGKESKKGHSTWFDEDGHEQPCPGKKKR